VPLLVNLLVAVVVTVALRAGRVADGADVTQAPDYHADEGSPRLRPVAEQPLAEGAATV
jgi:SSS family solute:Na+ symporter